MSHINKKEKTLTTKRKNNELNSKGKIDTGGFKNNTELFDSFVSVRSSKQQKDVSLLSVNSSNSPQDNGTDVFKFSNNPKVGSNEDKIFLEETRQMSPQRNIFDEETKIQISIIDSSPKPSPKEQYNPNESSIFFENVSKSCNNSPIEKFNNSKTSAERKTEDISFDDIVPIPEITGLNNPTTNSVTDSNLPEETDAAESNQCPICLKTFGSVKYLGHMKSCAAKNKLSTQQLLSALRLHKKQIAERKEIGLGIPVQSYKARVSPKRPRTNERKGPVDSSLQLAMALSASLHSAQEDEVILEAEALKEAGLCEEAEQKLSTLEKYGFASAMPPQPRSTAGGSKSRPLPPSLLLRRTQEERERIVTEKVAIVLISEEDSVNPIMYTHKSPKLKSKALKGKWDNECQLWRKSRCPEDERREAFYVKSLSEFVTPSKSEAGGNLRRLSQLPGRMNTPTKEGDDFSTPFKSFTDVDEKNIADLPTTRRSNMRERKNLNSTIQHKEHLKTHFFLSSVSEDWSKLVSNDVLSDIKIQCEHCEVIPAHKLVFYARCPKVLDELEKQTNGEYTLNWESIPVKSVLAFLDFVYCGKTDRICMLKDNDFVSINRVAERLGYSDLMNCLQEVKKFSSESTYVRKSLFKTDDTSGISDDVESKLDGQNLANYSLSSERLAVNKSEPMLLVSQSSLNSENVCNGRGSPDMFGESCLTESETETENGRDDLDILVSLLGKSTQIINSNTNKNLLEKSESMVIGSSEDSSSNEMLGGKRKASTISESEDEDKSLSKKYCFDLSREENFENCSKGETFDLTQSSDSSNGGILDKADKSLKKPESENLSTGNAEEYDLTQRSKSSNSKVSDSCSKHKMDTLEGSDVDDSLVDLTQKCCDDNVSKDRLVSPTSNDKVVNITLGEIHNEDSRCSYNMPETSSVKPAKRDLFEGVQTFPSPLNNQFENMTCFEGSLNSGRKSQPLQFSHSPSNISCTEKVNGVLSDEDNIQDYFDPVWDGYDDYYQFNCSINTSLKTPIRYQQDQSINGTLQISSSLNKFKGKQPGISPKSCTTDISCSDKSPRKLTQTVLSPFVRSPKDMKSISSDSKSPKPLSKKSTPHSSPIECVSSSSKSPKHLSQKSLLDYSPSSYKKSHHNLSVDSDLEVVPLTILTKSQSPMKIDFTKSRKNLTLRFDGDLNSDIRTCWENEKEISINSGSPQLSQKFQNSPVKSSLRKDSLAAMQRLLDDSLEISDSVFDTADAIALENSEKEPKRLSKKSSDQDHEAAKNPTKKNSSLAQDNALAGKSKRKTSVETPSPGIIVSDKVTPLPDYSGMKTPTLKKELSRFGLKPSLGRRKAKLLLRYIYDQTHPVVPSSEERTDEFKQPEGRPPRSPGKSPRKAQSSTLSPRKTQAVVNLDSGSESDDPCSQTSTSSSISSATSLPEESYHEAEDILTQDLSDTGDVCSSIRSLITGNPELHRKVLMYEPIYLEELMAMLKAGGIKSKANNVMDYLDEQCITFRTNSWKATNEKRRQKLKSPKKKKTLPASIPSSVSPLKEQAQVPKKRGRPKKNIN